MTRSIWQVLLIASALSSHVAAAQAPGVPSSFLSVRVDTRSGSSLEIARLSVGVLWVGGAEADLHGGYRALHSAIGVRLGGYRASVILGATVKRSTDGWYGGVGMWPRAEQGRLTASGMVLVYAPFQGKRGIGFEVHPARLFLRASSHVRIGLYYTRSQFGESTPEQSAGPSLQVTRSAWGVTLDAVRTMHQAADKVRVTLRVVL